MPTPITEEDLLAYVDDQLAPARRIEVEAYLQDHPALAARVMQDMRQRDEIRLFLAGGAGSADGDAAAAERTAAAVVPLAVTLPPPPGVVPMVPRPGPRLRAALAAGIFIAIGWSAHALVGNVLIDPAAAHPVPVFADEAVEAHRAAAVFGTAAGRPADEAPRLAEAVSRLVGSHLPVPAFPKELRPLASRILPWGHSGAVQVVYATPGGERVTLFAASDERFAVTPPEAADAAGLSVVYWRQGQHVYALCGGLPADELMALARAAQAPWF